jgi:predicted RNA-binding protein
MCEANAYFKNGDNLELVMEAVNTVEPKDGELRLENIFGDQKFLKARILALALGERKVILEPMAP